MRHTTEWLVPGRVLLQRLAGDVTLEDIVILDRAANDAIRTEGMGVVHSIIDLTDIGKYPHDLRDIQQIFRIHQPYIGGWMIVVTRHPLARFLSSMMSPMLALKFRICTSLDEARLLIQQHDDSVGSIT